nr:Class A beta-lactamase [Salmonella enterica subsp. enterica serovar Rissen]
MVTKRVQRMMFAAAACIPLLLGSAPLYAQTSAVQQSWRRWRKAAEGGWASRFIDTADNTQVLYRGDERFPMCSTSKVMAAAAVLKQSETQSSCLISLSRSSLPIWLTTIRLPKNTSTAQ